MELHKLKGNTYYIDGTTNIGLYKLNDKDCVLIDTGFAKVGPQIYEILKENNLNLKYILKTPVTAAVVTFVWQRVIRG